jgi:hypothetical protein
MAAKPGDDAMAAAAGRGRLRASHADRSQVLDVLKAAFVLGMLTKDEFDARVAQTLTSRTYAELAAVHADIPAGLTVPQPLRKPAPAQDPHPENKVVNSCACATIAVIALGVTLLTGSYVLFFMVVGAVLGTLLVVGSRMARASYKKRNAPGPADERGGRRERTRPTGSGGW